VQFARRQVQLKYAEVNNIGERTRCLHGGSLENAVLPAKNLVQELRTSRLADSALSLNNQQLSRI
jgi:hypothetical protein